MKVKNYRVQRDNCFLLGDPPLLALRFSHRQNESVTGTGRKANETLSLVIYYGYYTLKGFLTYRVLINSEKRF